MTMKHFLVAWGVGFLLFWGYTILESRAECQAKGGVWVARADVCLKKEAVMP